MMIAIRELIGHSWAGFPEPVEPRISDSWTTARLGDAQGQKRTDYRSMPSEFICDGARESRLGCSFWGFPPVVALSFFVWSRDRKLTPAAVKSEIPGDM